MYFSFSDCGTVRYSLIAKEQIKLPTSQPAIQTYIELVQFTYAVYNVLPRSEPGTAGLAIAPFVKDIASLTWRELSKALAA